ncbi:MAG TPA: AAA family ATPase, partial [Chthoniobacteraceae bacterium]|nr:AAA family ATPase [Chthoniobacteraceae bacterium]
KSESQIANDSTAAMLRDEVATRLRYLVEVGLGYLSLDRATRSLSGGEVERVNLTTCLGASLVNTLFVMDEPTVGLHPRDVGQLIRVMKNLRDKGNTLLVVEHEEAVIRAADNIIELGPGRGEAGGELVFNGPVRELMRAKNSLTADYLAGRKSIRVAQNRRKPKGWIKVLGASEHNLRNIDVDFPLGVFACITGVSGSGKSTLVHDVLYQNLLEKKHIPTGEAIVGKCKGVTGAHRVENVVMVDQSPLSRTPRSSPAVYLGVFDHIRNLFGELPQAQEQGLTPGSFSFNSGNGRCERCGGNGFEKIEMQFLSDLFVRCPECEGKKYQPHILKILFNGKSIHDVLELTVTEAIRFFAGPEHRAIVEPLKILEEVGLGYLRLGQPLNVLSGGESQRLKLISHLADGDSKNSLLIFDEPTTGLHFDDIALLLKTFNRLVEQGNSILVIEHNLEVLKSADYLIDLGPEAGAEGGAVVAAGTPEEVAQVKASHTGRYLKRVLAGKSEYGADEDEASARVAEEPARKRHIESNHSIQVHGAREHNLKNISLAIPRDKMVIITGLSGSGKSTLAFDILFAEGQRRFLDSMSPYARQFVEQLEKPDVDLLTGLPPTVAIEQRITRGGGKSTVATVTEVYHFLRLLFAKLGTQYCPKCNVAVEKQSVAAIVKQAEAAAAKGKISILAPLIKAKKGFHTEVAQWALKQGFEMLLVDGEFVESDGFEKLERFKEHSIDALIGDSGPKQSIKDLVTRALQVGKGSARILDAKGRSTILSTEMSCPTCGTSFEELDPRLFSFNSPHGWCNGCRGFGEVWDAAGEDEEGESMLETELNEERQHESLEEDQAVECPLCKGSRLNPIARHVRLQGMNIDDFTASSVDTAGGKLEHFKFDAQQKIIATDILPEISQRLHFMKQVGLGYL